MKTFKISGKTLVVGENAAALDYELTPVFTLLVQTTDSGEPPMELNATVRIVVEDVNDAPTDIRLNNSVVSRPGSTHSNWANI